jgi:hypothetical protein
MMTVEQLESECYAGRPLDFTRHDVEGAELNHTETVYPYGFPTTVRTNAPEILTNFREMWGAFQKRFDTEPIRVDVHLVEDGSAECPPPPTYRLMMPLMVTVADHHNYAIADLECSKTKCTISSAALRHKPYLRYFFLEGTAGQHVANRFTTPVHAGCVALNGHGVLLMGDSGAGKSSLSYACARAGWTFVSDDAGFLLNGGGERIIIGNCHQVRFRPTAAKLFPELADLKITPRVAGKPSIEVPTKSLPHMICAHSAQADFLVFLNRRAAGPPELVPYRRDVARYFMRQILYGPAQWRSAQYAAINQLLNAEVFEMRYTDLDWAVSRLEALTRMGC